MKKEDFRKATEYLEQGISYQDVRTIQVMMKNKIIACESLGEYEKAEETLAEYRKIYSTDSAAEREAEFIKTRVMTRNKKTDND